MVSTAVKRTTSDRSAQARGFVDEARRLAALILTENSPACGSGEDKLSARACHADVAQTPFFLELFLIVGRTGVREQGG